MHIYYTFIAFPWWNSGLGQIYVGHQDYSTLYTHLSVTSLTQFSLWHQSVILFCVTQSQHSAQNTHYPIANNLWDLRSSCLTGATDATFDTTGHLCVDLRCFVGLIRWLNNRNINSGTCRLFRHHLFHWIPNQTDLHFEPVREQQVLGDLGDQVDFVCFCLMFLPWFSVGW